MIIDDLNTFLWMNIYFIDKLCAECHGIQHIKTGFSGERVKTKTIVLVFQNSAKIEQSEVDCSMENVTSQKIPDIEPALLWYRPTVADGGPIS